MTKKLLVVITLVFAGFTLANGSLHIVDHYFMKTLNIVFSILCYFVFFTKNKKINFEKILYLAAIIFMLLPFMNTGVIDLSHATLNAVVGFVGIIPEKEAL